MEVLCYGHVYKIKCLSLNILLSCPGGLPLPGRIAERFHLEAYSRESRRLWRAGRKGRQMHVTDGADGSTAQGGLSRTHDK